MAFIHIICAIIFFTNQIKKKHKKIATKYRRAAKLGRIDTLEVWIRTYLWSNGGTYSRFTVQASLSQFPCVIHVDEEESWN